MSGVAFSERFSPHVVQMPAGMLKGHSCLHWLWPPGGGVVKADVFWYNVADELWWKPQLVGSCLVSVQDLEQLPFVVFWEFIFASYIQLKIASIKAKLVQALCKLIRDWYTFGLLTTLAA